MKRKTCSQDVVGLDVVRRNGVMMYEHYAKDEPVIWAVSIHDTENAEVSIVKVTYQVAESYLEERPDIACWAREGDQDPRAAVGRARELLHRQRRRTQCRMR